MENFIYSIPTKVFFGRNMLEKLPECILEFGSRVLLVYGGGSIKRTGLYGKIIKLFQENEIYYRELSGVEPNPRLSTVKKGVELCRKDKVDVILPVGGGSTIDCAKGIAAAYYYDGDPWNLVEDGDLIERALPIVAISTISATGSEMDPYAVITNELLKEKKDLASELLYPVYSILDPENTYTVSPYQTAAGTVDIMSHILEVYFNAVPNTYMQDRMMEALLKTCVVWGPVACREPDNYEARANLMWASEWAINGFIACGRPGPWPAHSIEHQLSAHYDVTHGHGLAIVIPALMRHILNEKSAERMAAYGTAVFGIDKKKTVMQIAEEAIKKTEELFRGMGLTMTLQEIGISDKSRFELMAEAAAAEGLEECLVPLMKEDILQIYENCYERCDMKE